MITGLTPAQQEVYLIEANIKSKVDNMVPTIVNTLGLSAYPISQLTKFACLGYIVLSCIMLFARTDFINLVLGMLCYYAVAVDRKQLEENYRYLIGMLLGALLYDTLWFLFSATVYLNML